MKLALHASEILAGGIKEAPPGGAGEASEWTNLSSVTPTISTRKMNMELFVQEIVEAPHLGQLARPPD